jgi:hypothetical protein
MTAGNTLKAILNSTRIFADSRVLKWVNRAERDIAFKSGCLKNTDTITTASGIRNYRFSGFYVNTIEYVIAAGNRSMIRILPKHLGRTRTEGAEPKAWYPWGSVIGVEPLPGATPYTLNAYVADYPEVEMTTLSETPSIPVEYRDLIVIYGLFMAALMQKRYTTALSLYADYRSLVAQRYFLTINQPDSHAGMEGIQKSKARMR